MRHFEEVRDGMRIEWDAPIVMSDGITLRCDIYRPDDDGKYPVILSYGPYGKGLLFSEGYPYQWAEMLKWRPEVMEGTSGKYCNWETVDPERWVPWGYICLRVDSRGSCNSEGFLDMFSPRETDDIYECIEWAAKQPWCDGKAAMNGISYFATNQWAAAVKHPPHLAACVIWEGSKDYYREYVRSGGILHDMGKYWAPNQIYAIQYGVGDRGPKNRITGENICGDITLTPKELEANRRDFFFYHIEHEMLNEEIKARNPDASLVTVPFLSSANWGGAPLHPRGNYEGFIEASSEHKYLEVHGDMHWGHFYTKYGVDLQKRFLDYFVKGIDNGWTERPGRVQLQVRHVDKFVERWEDDWPIPGTQWQKWYLTPDSGLAKDAMASDAALTYDPKGDGLTFLSEPFTGETEFTGPMAAKLYVSSASVDADLFLYLRLFTPDLEEVIFVGSNDPKSPVAMGWLRASHRKLDESKTQPYKPYHTHDEKQPLVPDEIYELDVEIHPTGIVVPKGYRVGLSVRGRDYVWPGYKDRLDPVYPLRIPSYVGSATYTHTDPVDRPIEVFGKDVTLHFSEEKRPYLLLPYIPAK